MIPYQDLVAALRHWRERNGLPNFGTDPGPSAPVMVKAPPGPPVGLPLARTAPPGPPPGSVAGTLGGAMDVDEIDAQELESEEIYENEGSDFALGFGTSAAPPPPPPPGLATDPGSNPDSDHFGTSTFDDDFVAEQSPAPQAMPRESTRPGVGIVAMDTDTADELVADDAAAAKPNGKKTKKKR